MRGVLLVMYTCIKNDGLCFLFLRGGFLSCTYDLGGSYDTYVHFVEGNDGFFGAHAAVSAEGTTVSTLSARW